DAPFQEFSSEHINFFGPASLTNLLARHGFSPIAFRQEMMKVNFRTSTPVIHAAYQLQPMSKPRPLTPDEDTISGLKKYVEQSRQEDERLHTVVDSIVKEGQPLIVWGTGSLTLRLLEISRLKDANLCAFVDSNPRYQGKTLNGVPIVGPDSLANLAAPI